MKLQEVMTPNLGLQERWLDNDDRESWPLLRPDKVSRLPSELLRVNLAELKVMTGYTSSDEEDAVAAYAGRQRARVLDILSERAARDRVRHLLSGETVSPPKGPAHETTSSPTTDENAQPVYPKKSNSTGEDSTATRLFKWANLERPHATTETPRSPSIRSKMSSGGGSVGQGDEECRASGHGAPSTNVNSATLRDEKCRSGSFDGGGCGLEETELDGSPGRIDNDSCRRNEEYSGRGVGVCKPIDDEGDSRSSTSAINSVIHKKWGSVFIVGGGRRRRRHLPRQRSKELDESPAARRAQMEKERHERRKASLRRLLARKEQRARQKDARRRRRAEATHVAKAVAASESAASTTVEGPNACGQPRSRRRPRSSGTTNEVRNGDQLALPPPRAEKLVSACSDLPRSQNSTTCEIKDEQGLAKIDIRNAGMGSPCVDTGQSRLGQKGPLPQRQAATEESTDDVFIVDSETSQQNLYDRRGDRGATQQQSETLTTVAVSSESESVSGGDSSDGNLSSEAEEEDETATGDGEDTGEFSSNGQWAGGKQENRGKLKPAELRVDETESALRNLEDGYLIRDGDAPTAGKGSAVDLSGDHVSLNLNDSGGSSTPTENEHANYRVVVTPSVSEHYDDVSRAARTVRLTASASHSRGDGGCNRVPNPANFAGAASHDEESCSSLRGQNDLFTGFLHDNLRATPDGSDRVPQEPNLAVRVDDVNEKYAASLHERHANGAGTAVEAKIAVCSRDDERKHTHSDAGSSYPNGSGSEENIEEDFGNDDEQLPGPLDVDSSSASPYPYTPERNDAKSRLRILSDLDHFAMIRTAEPTHDPNADRANRERRIGLLPSAPSSPPLPPKQNHRKKNRSDGRDDPDSGHRPRAISASDCVLPSTASGISGGTIDLAIPRSPSDYIVANAAEKGFDSQGKHRLLYGARPDDRLRELVSMKGATPLSGVTTQEQQQKTSTGGIMGTDMKDGGGTLRTNAEIESETNSSEVSGRQRNHFDLQENQRLSSNSRELHGQHPEVPVEESTDHNQNFVSKAARTASNRLPVTGHSKQNSHLAWTRGGRRSSTPVAGNQIAFGAGSDTAKFSDHFQTFSAVLSAHHNGRALTREADCRSLPLTSSSASCGGAAGAGGRGRRAGGLTASEEESCLHSQWKLYAIYIRVIKDYAAVFSFGDGWEETGDDDPSSLVYSGDPRALHYRVNSRARPEVYNIVTDVLNNRCEQWEELPTGLGLKTTWNLLWTWSKPHIQYSNLLSWQKVNHFPNSRELTRKDLLNKHISRFMAPGGRLAREFNITPQTFVLPHEFTQFVAAFTSQGTPRRDLAATSRQLRGRPGDRENSANDLKHVDDNGRLDDMRSFGEAIDEADTLDFNRRETPEETGRRKKGVWIMKPVGMSRGRGIRLVDDIKNISYSDKVVVQKYIGNPLLLDGYKFDLRLYVLVTSFNRLEAFIYKEGFARLSTHLYEKGDIGNRFIHLTNSSIQRLNDNGAAHDSPLRHASYSEAGGTKTTLSYLWRRLAARGVDVGELWAGICSVVVKSLVCVEGSIPNQPNSFELFGYDVLIDDRLRPWLIEVNSSPSMARENYVDRQVKEALIYDTIHLVDPLPFDRQKLVEVLSRRLSEAKETKARPFKQRAHSGPGPRHRQEHASKDNKILNQDLNHILCGRRPRKVGELPKQIGNFVRLCPGTAAHRHARRLRRKVVRPRPWEDDLDDHG